MQEKPQNGFSWQKLVFMVTFQMKTRRQESKRFKIDWRLDPRKWPLLLSSQDSATFASNQKNSGLGFCHQGFKLRPFRNLLTIFSINLVRIEQWAVKSGSRASGLFGQKIRPVGFSLGSRVGSEPDASLLSLSSQQTVQHSKQASRDLWRDCKVFRDCVGPF